MMSINIHPKPLSNDAIYFSSKNNICLCFLFINNDVNYYHFINNDVNYYPSKRKNDLNYGLTDVQRKICVLKESNMCVQEVGIGNCWRKK